ncbi:MAG TPA: radical SAM protein [Thermodesulfobacteriota bacterium]|nr:radical SAM protein [Thermodesulfobacteriota bacterium]
MRVLLINPPYPVCESLTMPLGLLYVAARLEEEGHEVLLEDLQLCRSPLQTVRRTLLEFNPRVVGITSFSLNLSAASRILRVAKRIDPSAITVWGGPHVSFDDVSILKQHPAADVVVRGEGEETLAEILRTVNQNKSFENVRGATWRGGDGGVVQNPPRPFREDLDQLPRPAWHLLKLSQYRAFGDGASLITSRGCPHRCLFCVGRKMIGAKGRFRTPELVVDEMESLVALGFRRLRIEDDLFTFRRDRALAICREIARRGLEFKWRAYSRVDTVDPELLHSMKKTGCERLLFGAESGSEEILKKIRKGITPAQTTRAVEMARDAGIGVLASFVLGLPGETRETLRQTLDFAASLRVPYTLNLLTPYVGTEIREHAEDWGIRMTSDDWNRYGQGHALTSTPSVTPWHLRRAVGEYRRGIREYLEILLEKEKSGSLSSGEEAGLKQNRYWAFLRKMIGDRILEKYGALVPEVSKKESLDHLVKAIAPHLKMPSTQVRNLIAPLIDEGLIALLPARAGAQHWAWS